MSSRRMRRALNRLDVRMEEENSFKAYLGKGDAASTVIPVDPNGNIRHGYVWARIVFPKGLQAQVIINRAVLPVHGYPVWVKKGKDGWEVEGSNIGEAAPFMQEQGLMDVAPHGSAHGFYGADPLYLFSQQLNPLGIRFGSGMTVTIEPLFYRVGNADKYFAGASLSLSSYLPVLAGGQRPVLIGLDTAANEIVVYGGGVGSFSSPPPAMPYTGANVVGLNTTSGVLSAHGIRLYYGQTVVDRTDYIVDARSWLNVNVYIGTEDPGAVGAGATWYDQSGGDGAWLHKVRNDADDDWEIIGGGGGSGVFANLNLSNLNHPTAINRSLLFNADNTYDVASFTGSARHIYSKHLNINGIEAGNVSSGVVALPNPYKSTLVINAEGGVGPDDVDTISGTLVDGDILYVRAATGQTITLKDGTGNLYLGGSDIDISDEGFVHLKYDGNLKSGWVQAAKSVGGSAVADDALFLAWSSL
jgi:hypothetical protein